MKICNVIRGEPGKELAVNISQVMVAIILKGIPQLNLLLLTKIKFPNVVPRKIYSMTFQCHSRTVFISLPTGQIM